MRLRSNLMFYEHPKPHPKGMRGALAKHGAKFKLSKPSRLPGRTETFLLGEQTVTLQAWQGLHFKKLPALVGMVLWLCVLAYWQLLLIRDEVKPSRPAWYPAGTKTETKGLTLGQVQRSALGYLVQLGTPTQDTRKAGKGIGRSKGYHPAARKRYPVVKKAKNLQNRVSAAT